MTIAQDGGVEVTPPQPPVWSVTRRSGTPISARMTFSSTSAACSSSALLGFTVPVAKWYAWDSS